MQFSGQGKPPLGIIFDSAMGASIDSALALALLYGLEGKSEVRLTSVSVSKPMSGTPAVALASPAPPM